MKTLILALALTAPAWCQQEVAHTTASVPSADVRGQGMYLFCHWIGSNDSAPNAVGRQLYLSLSADGIAWNPISYGPLLSNPPQSGQWFQDTGCGFWKGALVIAGDGYFDSSAMQLTVLLPDGTFSAIRQLAPLGEPSDRAAASPYIFVDPPTGNLYMTFQNWQCPSSPCTNTAPNVNKSTIYITSPVTQTLAGLYGPWTTPVAIESSADSVIDGQIVYSPASPGGPYRLIVKNIGGHFVDTATSSSLAGPYTLSGTDFYHYGDSIERPSLVQIDATHWRMYADTQCGADTYRWADSTDQTMKVFGPLNHITEPSGWFTYNQGYVTGCAPSSYAIRAGQVIRVLDPNWINTLRNMATENAASPPDLLRGKHLMATGAALTSSNVTYGAGAGTTAPVSPFVNGTDLAFDLAFTTTLSPVAGTVATVRFNYGYTALHCVAHLGKAAVSYGFDWTTTPSPNATSTVAFTTTLALPGSTAFTIHALCSD